MKTHTKYSYDINLFTAFFTGSLIYGLKACLATYDFIFSLPATTPKYSATVHLPSLVKVLALLSQTQQWIPLLPEKIHKICLNPKSSLNALFNTSTAPYINFQHNKQSLAPSQHVLMES